MDLCVHFAKRPFDAANKDVLEDGIGPHVLPMAHRGVPHASPAFLARPGRGIRWTVVLRALHCGRIDRKSTRLNSSHVAISYAVFCLKKKKINNKTEV